MKTSETAKITSKIGIEVMTPSVFPLPQQEKRTGNFTLNFETPAEQECFVQRVENLLNDFPGDICPPGARYLVWGTVHLELNGGASGPSPVRRILPVIKRVKVPLALEAKDIWKILFKDFPELSLQTR